MINPYEKIIKVIRDQGRTGPFLFTGILKTDGKCITGDLVLHEGEYLKLDGVSVTTDSRVLIALVDESFIILGKVV